ncbi:MAG: dipeptidase [Verrucomicrobiales bacterium]|nr:dipeptidase [Verrucomicrobiales bacterium]
MKQNYLDEFFELLRFPSISTDSRNKGDVRACGEWLEAKLGGVGLATELRDTAGHPVVLARNEHKQGRPTVMIYGHYDVQPVDPLELWTSAPFEPDVRGGKIFARGAADNKGQHFAHVLGVGEELAENGELPCNLVFLIEGEEEIGSPNLEPFLERYRDELSCDVVAISDTGMVGPGIPTFTYGLRGVACLEVRLTGPAQDLHSGIWGGAVANPATEIARLVASLHGVEGSVAVEGFYDRVRDLADWERESWAKLDGEVETQKLTGVPKLFGEGGYSALEQRWGRPTAEVNGIGAGYQGEGSKTVIASKAMAKLSCRLVPDQDPEEITELVEAHLRSKCPDTVSIEVVIGHSGKPYLVDPHAGFGKAAQEALRSTFGSEPTLIREGGSIPIVQSFKDVLGVDTLLLGLALPDCNAHAPDESFPVENFEAGVRLNRELLKAIAGK